MAEQQQTNPEAVEVLAKVLRGAGVETGYVGGEAFRRTVAERMLADPAPLLEALAQAGVLQERHQVVCSCGSIRTGAWKPHNEADVHDFTRERCYGTRWQAITPDPEETP